MCLFYVKNEVFWGQLALFCLPLFVSHCALCWEVRQALSPILSTYGLRTTNLVLACSWALRTPTTHTHTHAPHTHKHTHKHTIFALDTDDIIRLMELVVETLCDILLILVSVFMLLLS